MLASQRTRPYKNCSALCVCALIVKTTWRKLSAEEKSIQRVDFSSANRTFAKQMAVFAALVVVFAYMTNVEKPKLATYSKTFKLLKKKKKERDEKQNKSR